MIDRNGQDAARDAMRCMKCHQRPATVQVHDPSGAAGVVCLCLGCAAEVYGQDLVSGAADRLLEELRSTERDSTQAAPRGRCAECGLSGRELQRRGKVGCAACYEAFAEYFEDLIPKLHGASRHCGGRVGAASADARRRIEMEMLRLELEQAVAEEAFERAAQLRDALRHLECSSQPAARRDGKDHGPSAHP